MFYQINVLNCWANAITSTLKFADILIGLFPGVKIQPDESPYPANPDPDSFESSEGPYFPPSKPANYLPKVRNDIRSTSFEIVMRWTPVQ